MGLKRDKWKATFAANSTIVWQCPACTASPLRIVGGTLCDGETSESAAQHAEEWWEPEHVEGRFACLMDCSHCANVIGVTGTYSLHDDRHWDEQEGESGDYVKYYRPIFFTESPRLVDIPDATPQAVVDELLASFQMFWCDALACTNHIRSAVEKLLTAQQIPRTSGRRPGAKRQFLTLHRRIELFQVKHAEMADALMAIKWIGNAGSHAERVTVDDALDGYELMDWVLDGLYARRHRSASSLTRAINRRRAPRSPRRS